MLRRISTLGIATLALASTGCHIVAGYDNLELREFAVPLYAKQFGGTGDQSITAVDYFQGKVIVGGSFTNTIDLGNGIMQAGDGVEQGYIAVFDDNGVVQDSFSLGTSKSAVPFAVSRDLVVGLFQGKLAPPGVPPLVLDSVKDQAIFVIEYDAAEKKVASARQFGGENFFSFSQLDAARDSKTTVIAGGFKGNLEIPGCEMTTSTETANMFVAKFDENDQCVWFTTHAHKLPQAVESVAIDLSKSIVIAGEFGGTLKLGEEELKTAGGGIDFFLARFDADNQLVFAKSFGEPAGLQNSARVDARPYGNIAFAGYFDGTVDFGSGPITSRDGHDVVVVKFDPNGNTLWTRHFNIKRSACLVQNCELDRLDVAFDSRGDIVLAGQFGGTIDFGGTVHQSAGGDDIYLVKLDRNGLLLWSGRYGDSQPQCKPACHVHLGIDDANNVLLGGPFTGTVGFEERGTFTADESDAFLAKFAP